MSAMRRRGLAPGSGAAGESPEPVDLNRIAALLDGRLRGRKRRDALAQIAASSEAVEILADAASVLADAARPGGFIGSGG